MLFLIHERFYAREASFWWPWLHLLPETFDTPLYYTAEEFEAHCKLVCALHWKRN